MNNYSCSDVMPWRGNLKLNLFYIGSVSGVPRGGWGVHPPPEILKALQNRAKLNPIVETVKNYRI